MSKLATLCLSAAAAVGCQTAVAQSQAASQDLSVSIALRTFANRASGPGYGDFGIPGVNPVATHGSSGTEISYLPSIAVRYGRFVATGSAQPTTTYETSSTEIAGIARTKRKEWDLSIGYAILPSVVLSVGWKEISLGTTLTTTIPTNQTPLSQKFSGAFVGLSASAPLNDQWSLYGAFAYGRPQNKLGGTKVGDGTDYISTEFGVQYALRNLSASLDRATLIIGYRSQSSRTKDVPYSFIGINPQTGAAGLQNGKQSARSSMDGITLGIAYTF